MTPQQFERLPKYVKDEIFQLRRSMERLEEKVRQLTDSQTETDIWVEDYGADKGTERHYVQGESIVIAHGGVCLRIDAYRGNEIGLSWSEGDTPLSLGDVAFIPTSHQQARLVACQNMYCDANRDKK